MELGDPQMAVARGESRVRYMLITYVTVAVMIGVGLLLTFGVGVAAAIVGAHLANVSTSGLGDSATLSGLPERLLKGWFAVVEEELWASPSPLWRGVSWPHRRGHRLLLR